MKDESVVSTENKPYRHFFNCLDTVLLAGILSWMVLLTGCSADSREEKKEITVYAAASMTEVLNEAAAIFSRQSGIETGLEFASSGSLARKIEAGAPADVFISANKKWVDYLVILPAPAIRICVNWP